MSNKDLSLPHDFRKAVVKLRETYHHVETLLYDADEEYAVIRTVIREGTNPREQMLHRYGGSIYRKDVDALFTPGFDVYKSNDQPAVTKRALRRPTVRRLREEARDIPQAQGTAELWFERRQVQQELETLDYTFFRQTTLENAQRLGELRKALSNIDARLAFISQADDILKEG